MPADLGLGAGYNRWFVATACNLFNTGSPSATWAAAFKGLKAMLGFKSAVFDNNQSWRLYNDFWLNWTWREKSLLNSFFDAQFNYGYAHLYPASGWNPVVSAPRSPRAGSTIARSLSSRRRRTTTRP